MQSWFLLVAAILAEVGGTTCLKLSYGFGGHNGSLLLRRHEE